MNALGNLHLDAAIPVTVAARSLKVMRVSHKTMIALPPWARNGVSDGTARLSKPITQHLTSALLDIKMVCASALVHVIIFLM